MYELHMPMVVLAQLKLQNGEIAREEAGTKYAHALTLEDITLVESETM